MDNRAVVERIMKNLSFEVEAVPNKTIHTDSTNSSKNDPLNVKIKVRKKEINGPLSEPEIVLRKVRLVNSAETIMSFDMFMEAESEKKIARKPRKRIFKKLKPGLCLGVADDDDQPYTTDFPEDSSASRSDGILRQPFQLTKNTYDTFFSTVQRTEKTFLGKKCKPGGCLDPPFSEDKYSYEPSVREPLKIDPSKPAISKKDELKQNDADKDTHFDAKNTDKNKSKPKNVPITIKSVDDKIKESSSILHLYKVESPRGSVITYPPEDTNEAPNKTRVPSDVKRSSDAKISRPSSIDKSRQSINEKTFFSPPKGVKRDSSYIQQEPLKRHSFNPKSIKKPVPISASINSIPTEQFITDSSNNDIKPKSDIILKQQFQSEPDSLDIEKIDIMPFIASIHVHEETTSESINSSIGPKKHSIESIVGNEYPDNYEPFIIPIQVDEEVSAQNIEQMVSAENIEQIVSVENVDRIKSPIADIKKHSTPSIDNKKVSSNTKTPALSTVSKSVTKPSTQFSSQVYETANKKHDIAQEIISKFPREQKDANQTRIEKGHSMGLSEDNKTKIEKDFSKILSVKTSNIVIHKPNETSDMILTKDQKNITDANVKNEVTQQKNIPIEHIIVQEQNQDTLNSKRKKESNTVSDNNSANIYFDHKKIIPSVTAVITEVIDKKLLNTHEQNLNINTTVLDPIDKKLNMENIILTTQEQKNIFENAEVSDNLKYQYSNTQEQSLNVNTKVLYPSDTKLNLKEVQPNTQEHNLKEIQVNTQEQSLNVNAIVLQPSDTLNKHTNVQKQSFEINTEVLNSTNKTLNLEDRHSDAQEQSLNVNTIVLEPPDTLKDKHSNSQEQSLYVNTKVLHPSDTKLNLKDNHSNIQEQSFGTSINTTALKSIDTSHNLKDRYSDVQEKKLAKKVLQPLDTQLYIKDKHSNAQEQSFEVNTKVLNSTDKTLKLKYRYSDAQEQSLNVNTTGLEPSNTLKDKHSNTQEQSSDVNTKVLHPWDTKLNLKDNHSNIQEQSLGINTTALNSIDTTHNLKDRYSDVQEKKLDKKVLHSLDTQLNIKDKHSNAQEQSFEVNTEVLNSTDKTLNLKYRHSDAQEQSLNVNTIVLEPSDTLKDKHSNTQEQSLDVNTKVLHPSDTKLNLQDNYSNIQKQSLGINTKDKKSSIYNIDKNISEGTNPQFIDLGKEEFKKLLIHSESTTKQNKAIHIVDQEKNETQLPNNPSQILEDEQNKQNICKASYNTDEFPKKDNYDASKQNQEIIVNSLDIGKDSPKKIKHNKIIRPVDTNAIKPDINDQNLQQLESSNGNKPKENILPSPDINTTTGLGSIVLNLGFHSYINNKNERVIHTVVDGNKVSRYPQDSLAVIKSEIQLFANENYPVFNIPIDPTFDLAIKIKKNNKRNDTVPDKTRTKPVPDLPGPAKSLNSTNGNKSGEQKVHYPINENDKVLHTTLIDIYEQELIPLQKMIRELKLDIDELAGQQTASKKKLHGTKKNKLPRLIISNKKCGPCKP